MKRYKVIRAHYAQKTHTRGVGVGLGMVGAGIATTTAGRMRLSVLDRGELTFRGAGRFVYSSKHMTYTFEPDKAWVYTRDTSFFERLRWQTMTNKTMFMGGWRVNPFKRLQVIVAGDYDYLVVKGGRLEQ